MLDSRSPLTTIDRLDVVSAKDYYGCYSCRCAKYGYISLHLFNFLYCRKKTWCSALCTFNSPPLRTFVSVWHLPTEGTSDSVRLRSFVCASSECNTSSLSHHFHLDGVPLVPFSCAAGPFLKRIKIQNCSELSVLAFYTLPYNRLRIRAS